jgi:hypothetical protein
LNFSTKQTANLVADAKLKRGMAKAKGSNILASRQKHFQFAVDGLLTNRAGRASVDQLLRACFAHGHMAAIQQSTAERLSEADLAQLTFSFGSRGFVKRSRSCKRRRRHGSWRWLSGCAGRAFRLGLLRRRPFIQNDTVRIIIGAITELRFYSSRVRSTRASTLVDCRSRGNGRLILRFPVCR